MKAYASAPWTAYAVSVTEACGRGGDGQCDGYDPETSDPCECACHEHDFHPSVRVPQMEAWHRRMWRGADVSEDDGRLRRVAVTILLEVGQDVTDADLDMVASHAAVQVEEPADEEGEDASFLTFNVKASWAEVPA